MSGIAGAIDLHGERPFPEQTLHAMADALAHRGPDEAGYFAQDGVALAHRRLNIVAVRDGQQPLANEDRTIHVICHGALFEYANKRALLESHGHVFRTKSDAELLPHLWEQFGVGMFEHLVGQFAFVLFDQRQKRIVLARDRFGICPLHWSRQGDWLYFASEIKGLLASGHVPARPDRRGLNHAFTFFAMPGPITCFEGVQSLSPGHYLELTTDSAQVRTLHDRTYWQVEFPEQGTEDPGGDPKHLVDQFEQVMLRAVERRLHADVPIAAYLSGGIDSGLLVAMASKLRGSPIPTFTIRIGDPKLDETAAANVVAKHVGTEPIVVHCGADEMMAAYPRLIHAVEAPVIDTACAGLLLIAQSLQAHGFKTAITGEGADEWLASYPWYKIHKLMSMLDVIPGLPVSTLVRKAFLRITGAPRFPDDVLPRIHALVGGHNGWLDVYGVMGMSKLRFFSESMRQVMADNLPYADLQLEPERMKHWHPLHRALALGARIHLPGLLLHAKGDRVAMHSAVENRYPFLDDEVFTFLARLHPKWKLRGFQEKYILRLLAERWLPKEIAWKRKALFQAPLDSFHLANPPPFVEQLFSPESLRKTGYFDPESVRHWRQARTTLRAGSTQRTSIEMGLVGVLSTQLWHHLFIDATLADLPGSGFHSNGMHLLAPSATSLRPL
jgi:asparagine synthase (glutamine-hydrolysing)